MPFVPTVLTLSEVHTAKLLEEITEEVEQYEGVCHQLAYDRIVQLWDSRTYEYDEERGPPVVSAQGKYMATGIMSIWGYPIQLALVGWTMGKLPYTG